VGLQPPYAWQYPYRPFALNITHFTCDVFWVKNANFTHFACDVFWVIFKPPTPFGCSTFDISLYPFHV